MARLARVTQKIFAGSASNNGVFGSAQANAGPGTISNVLATIMGLAAWATGWVSATIGASKFPPLEEFQAVEYVHSTQIAYILSQGIAEYDAGTTYYTNQICMKAGTYQVYGSITNGNIGNALTDAGNWLFLGDLSNINNPSHFYSGGVTTGVAANQVLASVAPSGFSLSNDGSTVACTAGFACPGAVNFAIAGTTNTAAKIWNGAAYVNPAVNQFLLDETIFLTYNATLGIYVITDAPTLGTTAVTNLDTTNFQNTGGNLAFGTAPVIPSAATGTTQAANDNSTKLSTTAYADRAVNYFGHAFSESGAVATGSGTFTLNDVIPTTANGDQYLSVTYTPKSATNKLQIDVDLNWSNSSSGQDIFMGIFQDSNANALCAVPLVNLSNGHNYNNVMHHEMVAGTTSATTFKVRMGSTGGTITLNGNGGTRIFGGVNLSSITVTEVAP